MSKLKVLIPAALVALAVFAIPSAAQVVQNGGALEAVTPYRVIDTRPGKLPIGSGPLSPGQTLVVKVLGQGGVPSFGVSAIMGIVTVVNPTNGGYLTIFPTGQPVPLASNINFATGQTIANQFLVPVGANGSISIYNGYGAGVNIIIDVNGWISAQTLAPVGPTIAFDPAYLGAADSVKARQILQNANRYAMTTWWDGAAQTLLTTTISQANDPTDAVRRMGMQALSLSTSIATGVYDEVYAQTPEATAFVRTKQLIERVASQHISNQTNGWGYSWQTSLWASLVGRAAWYMWNDLSAATQNFVANMVASEADYSSRLKIHYLRDVAGTVLTEGDSGAEEVSWQSLPMQLALVMFPTHPHVNIWSSTLAQFLLAAWARPQDVASNLVVNGAPLSSWLKGSNVEANGVVVNHNRIASDYSTTTYQNLDLVPLFALANYDVPQAAVQLLGPVYAAFHGVPFGGGTTYVTDSADIYYPQGNDWGIGQKLPYALADAQALMYYNPGDAAEYLNLHLDAVLAQQARFVDGRTYLNDDEYKYVGREEHTAQLASQLYFTFYLRDHDLVRFTNNNYWLG
jgi:hypothetical protein